MGQPLDVNSTGNSLHFTLSYPPPASSSLGTHFAQTNGDAGLGSSAPVLKSKMVLPTVRTWLLLVLVVVANGEHHGTGQLDLTKSTIKTTLAALPAEDAVLIEFFASWCPACRCGRAP